MNTNNSIVKTKKEKHEVSISKYTSILLDFFLFQLTIAKKNNNFNKLLLKDVFCKKIIFSFYFDLFLFSQKHKLVWRLTRHFISQSTFLWLRKYDRICDLEFIN